MHNKILKILLFYLLPLILLNNHVFTYSKKLLLKDDPKILYRLSGSFTGDARGNITDLILYDDNTFKATFNSETTSGNFFMGQYSLIGTDFILAGQGEAENPDLNITTSNFTVYMGGILDINQEYGIGGITFIFSDWNTSYNCSYKLSILKNPEEN